MEEVALENRFCGDQVKPEYTSLKRARVAILPCPYDATTSYGKGTKNGPQAIIESSRALRLMDEELMSETYKVGIYTMPSLPLEGLSPEDMVDKVKREVTNILKSEKMPVVLGGEHSVSIGAVSAVSKQYKDLSVLHFDAHHDLRDSYDGMKFSHACVGRRFTEMCPVVQLGMRSLSKEEQDFLGSNPGNIKTVNVYDILESALWKDEAVSALSENVYISLDMDVFDPSIMPAVGTPEPGGMGWYAMLDVLRLVAKTRNVVGFDVVELMPIQGLKAPEFVTAKLIYKLLGYIYFSGRK